MTLPKEIADRIQYEAEMYGQDAGERITNVNEFLTHSCYEIGYFAGATHYATQLHTLQQENERLRKALNTIRNGKSSLHHKLEDVLTNTDMALIASAALTAQPEADRTCLDSDFEKLEGFATWMSNHNDWPYGNAVQLVHEYLKLPNEKKGA